MVPEVSVVCALDWTNKTPGHLLECIERLIKERPSFHSFEVIFVLCGATPIAERSIALPAGLPFSVRTYQTCKECREEGETLGAWLAYGQVLVFCTPNALAMLPKCDVSHVTPPGKVVMGWQTKGSDGKVWATAKRTFWGQSLFKTSEAWPSSISYVGIWLEGDKGDTMARERRLCFSTW